MTARKMFFRALFISLSVLWMGVIFAYSAKNSTESTAQSHAVGRLFGKIIYRDFNEWTDAKQEEFAAKWDHPIRKTAHVTEYMILGIFVSASFSTFVKKKYLAFIFSCITGILYAASDEIHQLFVPGRAGTLKDVGIDSIGVILGCILISLLFYKKLNSIELEK